MKGFLPVNFRIVGYVLLILSVFTPIVLYFWGCINDDKSLVLTKLGMKFVISISLLMIFLSKTDDEDNVTSILRIKALKYALFLWGVYYVIDFVISTLDLSAQQSDNSIGIYYMVMCVICFEFLQQKRKIKKKFKIKS